jgi:RNA polymerase sigma factor (sigma-70 family)
MHTDTDLGGAQAAFPATHCSLIRAMGSLDPAVRKVAQETLIAAYWKPIYKYIRVKWRSDNEDAKDLTQAFFTHAVEKDTFDRFDPAKARFRTYVRLCVDGFVAKEQRAAGRLKRGGGMELRSLDFAGAEGELRRQEPVREVDPEDYFRQEWVRGLFAAAVEDLRRECMAADKNLHFKLFERYDLDSADATVDLSYAQLAQEFGVSETQVTNYLAFARHQFRQLVLTQIRAATGTEEEYQDEVRRLFGGPIR